uniref:Heparan sulfate 2-O-sulfotransferase 1 n=1 Tax=Cyprinus carpio carpio TaxID=630221 RepID=A0A9J7Z5S8_CYPCA
MGLLRIMMPHKFQLLAVMAFGVAMLCIENQIQKLEESRAKLERTMARHEVREVEQRQTRDSLRDSPALPEIEDLIIIYNRVPKTASTSFTNIAYDLCGKNRFHVLHINTTKNNPVMSLQDQMRFVRNVTSWREMKPGFYHGHVAYLDFTKFGVKGKPVYINIVRDPIERLVSYYYFLRFGDDYRPGLRRRKQGDKKTFDECVSSGGSDCAPEKLWLQIPFFCGHYSECWNVGSRWALEQAKYNLVNEYLLVGVTEELEDFIMMLEAALPRFFRGATELYRTAVDRFTYLGSTLSRAVHIDDEVNIRIVKASAAFGRLRDSVWERTGIKQETKLKVYRAVVLPTLLYGCEAWTVYQRHAKKLNHIHLSCLRKLLRIKW